MSEEVVCSVCGASSPRGTRFCSSCGSALPTSCPACGNEVPTESRFCPHCGHRLAAGRVEEAEERKLVTIVFADLVGSTELGEQLDPEPLRAILARYFEGMTAVVESWGGRVEKYIGDAIMAVFGIPAMHEDDAERALGAALDMHARLDQLNEELVARSGSRLQMRIGVNSGEVVAGAGGDQFLVTGDPVNVAARLEQAAGPGEVLVGGRTYRQARGAFRFERRRDLELKGKSGPVEAWRLVERIEATDRRGVPGLALPMVGRDLELRLLLALHEAVVEEGRPRLALLVGEAGVGKTRLSEELLARLRAERGLSSVLTGRCLPYGEGITYWALREMLWAAAGISLSDPALVAAEKLRTLTEDALGLRPPEERERVLAALATTAGIAIEGNPLDSMAPGSIGQELGLAWPLFLSSLAEREPLVVVIEDLHWAEPPLLDMIELVVARSTGPVLLVATGRPEAGRLRPGWATRPEVTQVGLEALREDLAEELVNQILPGVGKRVRDSILRRVEGNPFFAQEMVRHLVERGDLEWRQGSLAETSAPGGSTLPDTVWALLAARIDGLSPEEKRVIQHAAVVGRQFWLASLEAIDDRTDVAATLGALESRGFLVARPASSLPGQVEFAFNHGLTREVTYASIPRARRADLHARVGEWIESLAGDRLDEFADLLAHHLASAAQPEDAALAWPDDDARREEARRRAVAALLRAGRVARTRFAVEEAVGFADRALALATRDEDRLAGLELRARAAHDGVRADEAWAAYLEALELAKRLGDGEAIGRLRTYSTLLWARYQGAFSNEDWVPVAEEIVEEGLAEIGQGPDSFELGALAAGRAHSRLAQHLSGKDSRFGPYDQRQVRADAERALAIADRIDSPHLLSHALEIYVIVVEEEGHCRSEELALRSLDAAGVIKDRMQSHEMLITASQQLVAAGQLDRAEEVARQAVADAISPHHRIHSAYALSDVLVRRGGSRRLALPPTICSPTSRRTAPVPAHTGGSRWRLAPYRWPSWGTRRASRLSSGFSARPSCAHASSPMPWGGSARPSCCAPTFLRRRCGGGSGPWRRGVGSRPRSHVSGSSSR